MALKKFEQLDSNVANMIKFKILIITNLSSYYLEIGLYDKAFSYYNKAVKIAHKNNVLHKLKYIISNIIIYFIHIKEYEIVKDAYQLLKKIAKNTSDAELGVIKALADLDFAFHIEKNFDKVEELIEINKSKFYETKLSFYKTNYTIYKIELSIYKNELRKAYNDCLILNKRILKEDCITYNLDVLLYLFFICTKDATYLNKIIGEKSFERFELNGELQDLTNKLQEECLKHKSSKIYCYNMLFEYFKSVGEYSKAFMFASDNIKQLQDPSFKNTKNELKKLIYKYEASKKIKLQNELIEKQKQLTRFYKEFAHSAAVELKSPLHTIKHFANLIKDALNNASKDDAKAHISTINITGQKMLLFLEQLLKQQNELVMQPIKNEAFKDIVSSSEKYLKKNYPNENYTLTYHTNYKEIKINSNVLKLILKNIAIFSICNKNPNKELSIRVNQLNKNLFLIKDNGKTIPKQLIKNIFNPFFMQNGFKIQGNIELAICKKVLVNCAGDIWIKSKTNEGNSYYFSIMQ